MITRHRMILQRPGPRSPRALASDETGATALEYGLIAALVSVAILSALRTLGVELAGLPLQQVIDAIQSVIS